MSELFTPSEFCRDDAELLLEITAASNGQFQPANSAYTAVTFTHDSEPRITHGAATFEELAKTLGDEQGYYVTDLELLVAAINQRHIDRAVAHAYIANAHVRRYAGETALRQLIGHPTTDEKLAAVFRPRMITYAESLAGVSGSIELRRTQLLAAEHYSSAALYSFVAPGMTPSESQNSHIFLVNGQPVAAKSRLNDMRCADEVSGCIVHGTSIETAVWQVELCRNAAELEMALDDIRHSLKDSAALLDHVPVETVITALRHYGQRQITLSAMEVQFDYRYSTRPAFQGLRDTII